MTDRRTYDAYPTPPATIQAALDRIPLAPDRYILEPCAGAGRILQACAAKWPRRALRAVEIDPQYASALQAITPTAHITDFRTWAEDYRRMFPDRQRCGPGLIISNPPFGIAQEILEVCFLVARPTTPIVMLLRLSFLESVTRKPFWDAHPLTALYPLAKRPSFTEDRRTLGQGFGWFVWQGTETGVFVI